MIGCISRVFTPWTFCGAVVLIAAGPVLAQNLVFTPVLSAPVGAHPEGLTVGDFNEDGHLDIATANSDSDDVSVLLGNGNGTFRSGYSFGVGKSPMFLTTGDLNLDGTLDLAVAETGADRVVVLFGKGNGFFEEPVPYPSGKGPTFLALGDVDGDEDPDMVVVNSGRFGHYPPFSWSVLLNKGQGDFVVTQHVEEQDRRGLFPTGASLADLDDDGLSDLTLTWSQPSWRTPNGYVSVFRNQGRGTFSFLENNSSGVHAECRNPNGFGCRWEPGSHGCQFVYRQHQAAPATQSRPIHQTRKHGSGIRPRGVGLQGFGW